ncbi:hypothetical protein LINPERPRIM_LOCUS28719 [Linum perenne]
MAMVMASSSFTVPKCGMYPLAPFFGKSSSKHHTLPEQAEVLKSGISMTIRPSVSPVIGSSKSKQAEVLTCGMYPLAPFFGKSSSKHHTLPEQAEVLKSGISMTIRPSVSPVIGSSKSKQAEVLTCGMYPLAPFFGKSSSKHHTLPEQAEVLKSGISMTIRPSVSPVIGSSKSKQAEVLTCGMYPLAPFFGKSSSKHHTLPEQAEVLKSGISMTIRPSVSLVIGSSKSKQVEVLKCGSSIYPIFPLFGSSESEHHTLPDQAEVLKCGSSIYPIFPLFGSLNVGGDDGNPPFWLTLVHDQVGQVVDSTNGDN